MPKLLPRVILSVLLLTTFLWVVFAQITPQSKPDLWETAVLMIVATAIVLPVDALIHRKKRKPDDNGAAKNDSPKTSGSSE